MRTSENSPDLRRQFAIYTILWLLAAASTGLLSRSHAPLFDPYFGRIEPLLAVTIAGIAGVISLAFLNLRESFYVYRKGRCLNGVVRSAILATIFAFPIVIVDIVAGFPADLNVPLPFALPFYPAMGYVAEIVFHTIPLAILLFALNPLRKGNPDSRIIWPCVILSSFVEPIFQLSYADKPLSVANIHAAFHIYAFSLVQLYVFRRYDFVAMFSLRLVYYLHWHIVWGAVRLSF